MTIITTTTGQEWLLEDTTLAQYRADVAAGDAESIQRVDRIDGRTREGRERAEYLREMGQSC